MAKLDIVSDPASFISPHAYANAQAQMRNNKAREQDKTRKTSFTKRLGEASEELENSQAATDMHPEDMDIPSLLDDIHSAGDALKERSSRDNLLRYKEAVKNFLHFVVKNGYTVGETWVRKSLLEKKKLTIVRIVDTKLEQLAAGILGGQKAGLDLLARIEEINGLLVDLLQ